MLNFTLSATPDTADVALEMLQHIERAISAMRKAGAAVAERVAPVADSPAVAKAPAAPIAAAASPEPEPEPAQKKPPAAKKPVPKKSAAPTVDDMDDDALLAEARNVVRTSKDQLGVRPITDTLATFGARALTDLDRDGLVGFIAAINLLVSEAA